MGKVLETGCIKLAEQVTDIGGSFQENLKLTCEDIKDIKEKNAENEKVNEKDKKVIKDFLADLKGQI